MSFASLVPELCSNVYTWKAPAFRTVGKKCSIRHLTVPPNDFCVDGHFGTWIQHSHIRCSPKHLP
jgi:hypothetical protein